MLRFGFSDPKNPQNTCFSFNYLPEQPPVLKGLRYPVLLLKLVRSRFIENIVCKVAIFIIIISIASFEEPLTRPHSEAKTWAPSSLPSAPQSAPPELAAQHKSQHSQHSGYKSPESESVSLGSFSGINGHKDLDSERDSPLPTNAQDIPTKDEKVSNYIISLIYYIIYSLLPFFSHLHTQSNCVLSFKHNYVFLDILLSYV